MSKEEILTLQEVSRYLRSSKDTLYRMAKRGDIPCFKVGKNWRFKKERVDGWLLRQEKVNRKKLKVRR